MKKYMIGLAVLAITIIGPMYGRTITITSTTWGQVQSGKIVQIIHHQNGSVDYGILESSGAEGDVTTSQSCNGWIVGDIIYYQDSNQGTRRLYNSACEVIPN